jgi:hypothetical protein
MIVSLMPDKRKKRSRLKCLSDVEGVILILRGKAEAEGV